MHARALDTISIVCGHKESTPVDPLCPTLDMDAADTSELHIQVEDLL
jgi:hypothetical protein